MALEDSDAGVERRRPSLRLRHGRDAAPRLPPPAGRRARRLPQPVPPGRLRSTHGDRDPPVRRTSPPSTPSGPTRSSAACPGARVASSATARRRPRSAPTTGCSSSSPRRRSRTSRTPTSSSSPAASAPDALRRRRARPLAGSARRTRRRRGRRRCAPARCCWPPPACSTASRRRPTGSTATTLAALGRDPVERARRRARQGRHRGRRVRRASTWRSSLAARIAGDVVAQAIQLVIEYDPQPPFDAGALGKAPPAAEALVRAAVDARRARAGV